MDTTVSVANDWKFELESAAATQAVREKNEAERKEEERRQRQTERNREQGQNLRAALKYLGIELTDDPSKDRVTVDGYTFELSDYKTSQMRNNGGLKVEFSLTVSRHDPLLKTEKEAQTEHERLYRHDHSPTGRFIRFAGMDTDDWVEQRAKLAATLTSIHGTYQQNQQLWARIEAGEFDKVNRFGESLGDDDETPINEPIVDETAELREQLWQKDSEIYRLRAELEALQTVKTLAEAFEAFLSSRIGSHSDF